MSGDLYQRDLLRHAAAAHGSGRLADPDGTAMLDNPLCGDRVTVDVKVRDGRLVDLGHEVRACVLCQASASIVGERATGQPVDSFAAVEDELAGLLRDGSATPDGNWSDLAAFEPVRGHRSRHACVLLPFETLIAALHDADN